MAPKEELRALITEWEEGLVEDALLRQKERKKRFQTESGIRIERLYTPHDLERLGFDYDNDLGFPGMYPFTRGKNPLGYRGDFWLFQQYAGFGDAEEANKRYRFLLDHGQTGISMALDLPTQVGLDSDHPMAEGEVGKVGVAIDTLEDLETVFRGIPLNKPRQISIVANSMSVIALAMFIALAKKQKVPTDEVVLRIQNDILKEFIARGTYIYPPRPSLRLATDVITYCVEHHPNWLPLTLCGYHIREAGASSSQEIALSLANALEYLDDLYKRGVDVQEVLPKLSVMLSVGMNFFEEIAKFRAIRRLWARVMRQRYHVKDLSKLSFHLVNFTAGSSLTAQQPMNNVVRVTIECLAGVLGGCQSLFPCSMDEAFCTPTENAVKLALRTQQIIAYETDVADTVDPLGGSYFLESLTHSLEKEAKKHLDKIEKQGGAISAIESGYIQGMVGDEAYKKQREVENKERIIVGVNQSAEKDEIPIEIFKPPKNAAERQKNHLKELRHTRNNRRVREILSELEQLAETEENVVPMLIEAVENYTTLGEICDVFRRVHGEYTERPF
jgi:methylmalonyl-CoA mutase N-terminal domain/subunit